MKSTILSSSSHLSIVLTHTICYWFFIVFFPFQYIVCNSVSFFISSTGTSISTFLLHLCLYTFWDLESSLLPLLWILFPGELPIYCDLLFWVLSCSFIWNVFLCHLTLSSFLCVFVASSTLWLVCLVVGEADLRLNSGFLVGETVFCALEWS